MTGSAPRRAIAGRTAAWAAPLLLVFLVLSFYWRLVFTDQYSWLENGDGANMILPWLQFQASQWHQWRFPLWDPHLWGGQTLIGQVVPAAAYPPNWILFLLPLDKGFLKQSFLNWYWVLLHAHAALFCYFFCRDLRLSRAASMVGGLAFTLAGYAGVTGFPEMLAGFAWAPAVFLFQFRALRGENRLASAALSGACLGAAWLSGHHQVPIFVGLGSALLWIQALYTERRFPRRALESIALFGLMCLFTGGLQILPAYEYGKLARRWLDADQFVVWNQVTPYYIHRNYSLQPAALMGIVLPGIHEWFDPFQGMVTMTLAFLGTVAGWRYPVVRRLALLAAAGALLALGHYSLFHGAVYALVPFVEKARTPAAAFCLCSLAIAVMAAYAIDEYPRLHGARWLPRLFQVLTAFASLLLSLLIASMVFRPGSPINNKIGLAPWIALALAGILFAWARGYVQAPNATALLVSLMLLELGAFISVDLANKYEANSQPFLAPTTRHADIAAFLASLPGPFRISVDSRDIPYNFGDRYGIDQFEGHVGSLTENLARQDWASMRIHNLYGVRYHLASAAQTPEQKEIFRGASGVRVFQNPDALPRAWTVHTVVPAGASFDPRRSATINAPLPALETCSKEDVVKVAETIASSAVYNVEMACRGLLVISDNYFPGWTAIVDGKNRAQVLEVDSSLRGVVVEAGVHSVRMVYRPATVYAGGAMSALGALIAAVLWWRTRKKPSIIEPDV